MRHLDLSGAPKSYEPHTGGGSARHSAADRPAPASTRLRPHADSDAPGPANSIPVNAAPTSAAPETSSHPRPQTSSNTHPAPTSGADVYGEAPAPGDLLAGAAAPEKAVRPLGVLDMLRVGIGPSSSHTVGPMRAGRHFAARLADFLASGDENAATGQNATASSGVREIDGLTVDLFGSLGATGRGHNTDRAVILGIAGYAPETVEIPVVDGFEAKVDAEGVLHVAGLGPVPFVRERDIHFLPRIVQPYHVNALTITATRAGAPVFAHTYYSVGGGFVMEETARPETPEPRALVTDDAADATAPAPYPYSTATELLAICDETGLSVSDVALANESAARSREAVLDHIHNVFAVMTESIEAGIHTSGELPGILHVKRRAPEFAAQLAGATTEGQRFSDDEPAARVASPAAEAPVADAPGGAVPGAPRPAAGSPTPSRVPAGLMDMGYVNLYALAVNEENAAGHRIVTAPTNGAAGIVAAVSTYYLRHVPGASRQGLERFILAAGAMGGLIKTNASIAGAEVGCQGEVGSAAAMAAAGLTEALGGTPHQVENAAEIAMEHSLGLTCDPVAGLVQIPCIERNAMASVKAINASYIALWGDGSHAVDFDTVITTMRQVGEDMLSKYKETSEGGLAVNVVEC